MRILNSDFKKGTVRVALDQREDAWHIFKILSSGDLLFGQTERKIKLGGEGEKGAVIKRIVWVEIAVEKSDIQGEELRVNGIVTKEYEEIPKGSHQSISLCPGTEAVITKKSWGILERQRLDQAARQKPLHILAVVFDREEALIAQLTGRGFEIVSKEKGEVAKKGYEEGKGDFFRSLSKTIGEMDSRLSPTKIIIASPSFWKEYLLKEIGANLRGKVVLASVSACDETAFNELIRRPELENILSEDRTMQEEKVLEEGLESIREDFGCYGQKELGDAADQGNLKKVMVSEEAFSAEDSGRKSETENFLSRAEAVGAEILILTQDSSKRKLSPFKGMLGIKRWKTS